MWILIFLTYLLIETNYAFSACAEVDIIFVVDTASIINNGNYISQFITSIIWHGSSEQAGFSVILYGDNIPINQDIFIVNLKETYSIKQRQKEEQAVSNKLALAFDAIKSVGPDDDTKSVELIKAFKIANKQNKPKRKNRKKSKLNKKNKNYRVDIGDDENEYFIFDYNNKLLLDKTKELMSKYIVPATGDEDIHYSNDSNATYSGSDNGANDNILNRKKTVNTNRDICFLLNHDANNDDETMHILLGQKYESLSVICNEKYPSNIDKRTFFYFDSVELLDNPQTMETIYDITCPANIETPEWSGGMNLGNHVQWIDDNIITACNLEIIDEDNIEKPIELDIENSYILARDYLDDDNTFKKNDYLIAPPEIEQEIENIGCWSGIYQIIDIEVDDNDDNNEDYIILRLTVNIPKSPLEYIFNANVKGDNVGLPPPANDNNDNNRALLSFLTLSSGGTQTFTFFDTNDFPGVFDKEWTYSKTTSATYSVGTAPKFTFTGTGTITLKTGFDIDLSISLDFNFNWDVLSNDIYIYFTANINYGVTVWFNAELVGNVEAAITDLLKFSKYITFSIGPVPVIIKPFITLNAKLTTIPLRVYGGVECHYGETLKIGYSYDKDSIFHAQYGRIRSNYRYTLSTVKQWDNVELDTCVRQNYEHGAGAGLTCVWFDYNPNNMRCRCYGAGVMMGDITYESGTTAYIMNKKCNSEYWHKCDGCGSEIWVKEDGNSFSCSGTCCCRHGIFPYSCTTTCKCFPGWYHWYCISCPLLQSNSGWEETTVNEGSINTRTPHSNNGCTKTFEIGSEEENEEECPVMQLGFDIEVEAKIGCNLYSIVTVYGRAVLDIPFRITIPEFDDSLCSGASQSCDNTLKTSFTIAMDLSFYLGVAVDFGDLGALIEGLVNGGSEAIGEDFSAAEVLIGSFEILPVTSLGCIELNGILSILDGYYKDKCCVEGPEYWFNIGYLENIDTLLNRYSPLKYDYGIQYNSGTAGIDAIHEIIINSWNRGTRISTKYSYPMGDTSSSLRFGKVVLTNNLDDNPNSNDWYHYYYYTDPDEHKWSNGIGNTKKLFAKKLKNPWIEVGTLSNIESLVNQYPMNKYEYGIQYNSGLNQIHSIIANSWNKGVRISTIDSYPMGDSGNSLRFGKIIVTKGLNGNPTSTDWYGYYYYMDDTYTFSNGNVNHRKIFRRSSTFNNVGTLGDIEEILNTYNPNQYEFAMSYNRAFGSSIKPLTINSWDRGIRVSSIIPYPMGDTSTSLNFGKTILTNGLNDNSEPNYWYHYYYFINGDQYRFSNNGDKSNVGLYGKQISQWTEIGILENIEDLIINQGFSLDKYEIGINGIQTNSALNYIFPIIINSWNVGLRISSKYSYPMGNDGNQLKFGKMVLTKGLYGNPTSNDWYYKYYYIDNDQAFSYSDTHVNHIKIFAKSVQEIQSTQPIITNIHKFNNIDFVHQSLSSLSSLSWVWIIIGALLIMLLSFNIYLVCHRIIWKKKNGYLSVKRVDSEYYDSENNT